MNHLIVPPKSSRGPLAEHLSELLAHKCPIPAFFTAADCQALSELTRAHTAHLDSPPLSAFISQVIQGEQMVHAYFYPVTLPAPTAGARPIPAPRLVIPWELACTAADAARRSSLLLPPERPLAWAATIAWLSGVFMGTGLVCGADELAQLRASALDWPLKVLRRKDAARGALIGAALGQGEEHGCDPQQVARLASAIHLGVRGLGHQWQEARHAPVQ